MSWWRLQVALALCLGPLLAQEPKPGDSAPPLAIAKWLKGKPVESFERGKAHVVAFWTTWCPSCAENLNLLADLQRRSAKAGGTFVAVTTGDPRNTLAAVEARVRDKGQGWSFAVAWDDGRKTADAWGQSDPKRHTAFVVDASGKVTHAGKPQSLAFVLDCLETGCWDPAKFKGWAEALKEFKDSYEALPKDQAPAALARLEGLLRECPALSERLGDVHVTLLLKAGKYDQADTLGKALVDQAIADRNDPLLNNIAWAIVTPSVPYERRNLDLALQAAEKAVEFTDRRRAGHLDTLARVHAWKKDHRKALEVQRRAIVLDPKDLDLQNALKEYEAAVKPADAKDQQPSVGGASSRSSSAPRG